MIDINGTVEIVNQSYHWIDYTKAFGSIAIAFSVVFAARQFLLNKEQMEKTNKWNKKEAAIKALHESPMAINESRLYLNKHLKVNPRIEKGENFTIQELHNELGVFLKNGCFVFHGEQTQENVQMCRHEENDPSKRDYCIYFDEHKNGRETYNHITALLNEYEYLAMACNKDIFDKHIVIELKGTGFIAVFNLFSNHIYHKRHDTRHGGNKRLYRHLETFCIEIESILRKNGEENIPKVIKPLESQYLTPFERC